MAAQSYCGIVHNSPDSGTLIHLPLEEVSINALIVDVSARVTLTQVYSNPSVSSTPRAKYVFPIPARAAVCAFEMHTLDGRVLIGVAKDKKKAREEHENAIQQGKMTSLVEWVTDDVFTISIGSIPGNEVMTTKLVYVMDLMDNGASDQVRLQLPMCVGERYGGQPPGMQGAAAAAASRTRLRITVHIQTSGEIRGVASPTHASLLSLVPYLTHQGRSSRHRTTAKLRSPDFLTRDFVLSIKAEGLDSPRCFAERHPHDKDSIAMQLTIVPNFVLPRIAAQEYIFVVDRSGSMANARIETAKRTLVMLLQTLPNEHTMFNIFSFGSRSDPLWAGSVAYTDSTLHEARTHVKSMDADYGGTEICSALQHVFRSRHSDIPTAVFVLTDGEAYAIERTIGVVQAAVAATPDAPLRVFTLGIGDTTSTAMCEGIARAGNGECLMTSTAEGILGKCASLIRAGRSSILRNVTVDWGIPPGVSAHDAQGSAVRFAGSTATVQQAPHHIPSINLGHRFIVFALIQHENFIIPKQITLRAQKEGDADYFSCKIAVEHVKFADEGPYIPLVHTLAARRLIMDIEDEGRNAQASPEALREASITRLGEKYQLASRYTSFVAVEGERTAPSLGHRRSRISTYRAPSHAPRGTSSRRPPPVSHGKIIVTGVVQFIQTVWDYGFALASVFMPSRFGSAQRQSLTPRAMPGRYDDSRTASPSSSVHDLDGPHGSPVERPEEEDVGAESDHTFSTLSSLFGHSDSDWSDSESQDERPLTPPQDENARSPSPIFNQTTNTGDPSALPRPRGRGTHVAGTVPTVSPPQAKDSAVYELVHLQSYDGSFSLSEQLKRIVGEEAVEEVSKVQADGRLCATALAVAFYRKHLAHEPELLEGLLEKVMKSVMSDVASRAKFDEMVDLASTLVH